MQPWKVHSFSLFCFLLNFPGQLTILYFSQWIRAALLPSVLGNLWKIFFSLDEFIFSRQCLSSCGTVMKRTESLIVQGALEAETVYNGRANVTTCVAPFDEYPLPAPSSHHLTSECLTRGHGGLSPQCLMNTHAQSSSIIMGHSDVASQREKDRGYCETTQRKLANRDRALLKTCSSTTEKNLRSVIIRDHCGLSGSALPH